VYLTAPEPVPSGLYSNDKVADCPTTAPNIASAVESQRPANEIVAS